MFLTETEICIGGKWMKIIRINLLACAVVEDLKSLGDF